MDISKEDNDHEQLLNTSFDEDDDNEQMLTLSLSIGARSSAPAPPPPVSPLVQLQPSLIEPIFRVPPRPQPSRSPPPPSYLFMSNSLLSSVSCQVEALEPLPPSNLLMSNPPVSCQVVLAAAPISCPSRARKHPAHVFKSGKSEALLAPYPWAKTLRAKVHRLDYLLSNGISMITGNLYCKRCDKQYEVKYDLRQKFSEVASFVWKNKAAMHDRAPVIWMNPNLPNCQYCDQNNNVKLAHSKKRSINWLFLFLGQMLGCCKLAELKYFCKHTKNHRTGAKDRLIYLTYLDLCKQLDPNRPFHL
jgi:uncharacterized protein YbaR (Trm112 family)